MRFLRSQYHKGSSLEVLDVTPPPAIPEQTVEDLLENREFWRHLGREYRADLQRLRKVNEQLVVLLRRYQEATTRRGGRRVGVQPHTPA